MFLHSFFSLPDELCDIYDAPQKFYELPCKPHLFHQPPSWAGLICDTLVATQLCLRGLHRG